MNDGYSKLHQTFKRHIQKVTAAPSPFDLAAVQADLSIKPDRFAHTLPSGDYLRCASAALIPGDRVLAVWVGSDLVVIGKVVT